MLTKLAARVATSPERKAHMARSPVGSTLLQTYPL